VRSYQAGESKPLVFRLGETAFAEAAMPGWRFRVDGLFE
jgi:hypothetical protein